MKREAQKQGIGFKLAKEAHATLVERGVQAVGSIAWKNGEMVNLAKILEMLELKPQAEIQNFWTQDSLKYQQDVPLFVDAKYATYMYGDFYDNLEHCFKILKGFIPGRDLIGVKEDTPVWFLDEYEEWVKYHKELGDYYSNAQNSGEDGKNDC